MTEGGILTSDMEENGEMRTDAFAQANIAMQKFESEKDIAKHVRGSF
jgi:dynein light chain LC8-type